MTKMFSLRTDIADSQRKEYKQTLESMTTGELLEEFFSYLNYTEESDSGREFHPVIISNCRIALSEPLSMVLKAMRSRTHE